MKNRFQGISAIATPTDFAAPARSMIEGAVVAKAGLPTIRTGVFYMKPGKPDVKVVLSAIGLLLAGAGTAGAADYNVGSRWFKSADTDRDQRISREEADVLEVKRFSRLDRDSDGTVTVAEIDQYLSERIARQRESILRRLDADRDRSVTRAEIDARTADMFATLDADSDGGITSEEIASYREARRARGRAARDGAKRN